MRQSILPSLTARVLLTAALLTTCQSYCASQGQTCAGTCIDPYGPTLVGGITLSNTTCTAYTSTATCSVSISTAQGSRCCCAQ